MFKAFYSLFFLDLGQFRIHVADHTKLGLEHGQRRFERRAVLSDIGHARRCGLRSGHRFAGHFTDVCRPDHSTGAVFVQRGYGIDY